MGTVLPSPCAQSGVPYLRKRSRSPWFRLLAPSAVWLPQSPVNPKPCGTFSWPTSKSPLSPFSMAAKSLLLPKPRGKKKHSKTTWSSSFPFRTAWSSLYFTKAAWSWPSFFPLRTSWYSPLLLQNHMDLYLSTCFRTSWFSHLLQSHVVYSPYGCRA